MAFFFWMTSDRCHDLGITNPDPGAGPDPPDLGLDPGTEGETVTERKGSWKRTKEKRAPSAGTINTFKQHATSTHCVCMFNYKGVTSAR